jgi:hypothetical protein
MRRILLDESTPAGLARLLNEFEVKTVPEMGWAGMTNGRLLNEAEQAGFDVLLTADQNLRWQQRLANRKIGVVVLSTNRGKVIRTSCTLIEEACGAVGHGAHIELRLGTRSVQRRKGPSPEL